METKIYKSKEHFDKRKDKKVNGVSPSFAKQYPNFKTDNNTNNGCWDCYHCYHCSGCSGCSGCPGCSGCWDCYHCSDCYDCSNCYDCHDKKGVEETLTIPKIENIHQEILKAVSVPNSLDMSDWHTCDTTHCRAGWVTFLAEKEGKELENKTSTAFAAFQIYKASSDIKVNHSQFYISNESAMKDIKRCAKLEIKQNKQS